MLEDAISEYKKWKPGTEWAYTNIDKIYEEVNTLKHDPSGLYRGRTVELADAVLAIDEVLKLVEAWNEAGRP